MSQTVQANLLGKLHISIENASVTLPKSRKTRALLAYLLFTQRPITRVWLSEFLFADTSDPKGNLRWCLSRLNSAFEIIDENLICSDALKIWVTVPPKSIDVHQLSEMQQRETFGVDEFELLEAATQGLFLPNLTLARSPDFEAWRATTQSSINSMIEDILDAATACNLGSDIAIKFAQLFVNFAPDLEKAWYLLVMAYVKTNQMPKARAMLSTAYEQLNENAALQSGLLALALNNLDHSNSRARETYQPASNIGPKSGKPRIYIASLPSTDDPVFEEFQNAFSSSVALNNRFTLLTCSGEPNQTNNLNNADFILSPSVTKLAETYQLDLQLIDNDTKNCLHGWQLELRSSVTTHLRRWLVERFELDMPMMMSARALQKPQVELTALDYYYLALPRIHSPIGYSANEALELLNKSLTIDPHYGPALSALAWVRSTHPDYNETVEARTESARIARRAVELAFNDACAIGFAAISVGHLEVNAKIGLNFAKRALSINHYSPIATLAAALMYHYCGDYEQSIEHLDRLSQSNIAPLRFWADSCYALNYYQLDQLDEAIQAARQAVESNPGMILSWRVLVASLARSDKLEEARKLAKEMIRLDATEYLKYFERFSLYTERDALNRLLRDLELAGIPYSPTAQHRNEKTA